MRFLPVLVLVLSGCSFLGLSDDLDQSSCVGEEESFCGELNDIAPTGDACLVWQCDQGNNVCAALARDDDGDGAAAMGCSGDAAPDCDDEDEERAPGFVDGCDGIDNDCDDAVDEEPLAVETSTLINAANARLFDVTGTRESGVLVHGRIPFAEAAGRAFAAGDSELNSVLLNTGETVEPNAAGLAVDRVGTRAVFAIASSNGVLVGAASGAELPNVQTDSMTGAMSSFPRLAVEGSGQVALVSFYERDRGISESCAAPVMTTATLRSFELDAGMPPLPGAFPPPGLMLDVDEIGAIAIAAAGANRWLLARALPLQQGYEMRIVTYVPDDGTGLPIMNVSPAIFSDVSAGRVGDLRLDVLEDRVAIGYRVGCGVTSVAFRHFTLAGNTLTPASDALSFGDGARDKPDVKIVDVPTPTLFMTWTAAGRTVELARLDLSAGAAVGPVQTVLTGMAGDFNIGPRLLADPENGGVAVIAPNLRGGGPIERADLICAAADN